MIIPPLFRNQALTCAITLSLLAAGSASAAVVTWDGGGADISWTTGANWNANTAPIPSADALRFQGTLVANSNDFPAGTIFQKIDFRATTTTGNAAFDLVGNSVTLDAGSPITTSVITVGTLTDKISLDLSLSSGSPIITTGTAHNLNIAGVISGAANSLTKAGAATLTLSGVNTFSGKTVVSAGTLELTEARALQNSPLDALTSITGDAANGLKITTTNLTLGGLRGSTTNPLLSVRALASLFTTTSGGYTSLTELTLNVIPAADYLYNQVIANGAAGMSLIKTGAGTQIFGVDAAHTYSGVTTVSQGSLIINGNQSSATGALTVASGATLGGSGTIGGFSTINGQHSPGDNAGGTNTATPGVQTFNSGLTYSNGSTFVWELTGNTNSGRSTAFDGVNVSGGTLTIDGGVTNNLVFNGVGSTVSWSDAFWASNQEWLVFSNASLPTVSSNVFETINVGVDSISQSLTSVRSGSSFSWDTIGDDVYLTYAIPEPSTYALLALLGAGFAGRALVRRRRRHGVD